MISVPPSFRRARESEVCEVPEVYLTVDVEPDCPPYLWTWRGIEEGMPRLLQLVDEEGIPVTFFTTGQVAERYSGLVAAIVQRGHEIGNHGYSHGSFAGFDEARARDEIGSTCRVLREFAPVRSFRAPYLRFPERFMPILAENGIGTDASRARYKRKEAANPAFPQIARLEASVPTSLTRLPAPIRNPLLARLRRPVVLFVHPWEFVDITREPVPYDCRFRTGERALEDLREVIGLYRRMGARFRYVRECAAAGLRADNAR